jgi:myo-inositol-1(or 4)-monophosphatase
VKPDRKDLETLARGAGQIVHDGYGSRHQVEYKHLIDPVTEVDHRSEAFLIEAIKQQHPTHRIITEERGRVAGDASCVWVIDPLDGTVNYTHGVPVFSVSVAFMEDGVVRLGSVYDPMRDEMFSAELGAGAWMNGERLQVSGTKSLNSSLLATGFPYDIRTTARNNLDCYARFAMRSQGVRRLGSAALDMCYVAAGRFDGYWELHVELWDLAAAALIAGEAGARVTTASGSEDILAPPHSILAANPALHAQMLEVMQENET